MITFFCKQTLCTKMYFLKKSHTCHQNHNFISRKLVSKSLFIKWITNTYIKHLLEITWQFIWKLSFQIPWQFIWKTFAQNPLIIYMKNNRSKYCYNLYDCMQFIDNSYKTQKIHNVYELFSTKLLLQFI